MTVLVSGCQSLFPPPLAVTASGPAAGRYSTVAGLSAWVRFSTGVPHGKTEKGITLQENGTTMAGRYTWEGNKVTVVPDAGFSLGKRYDLTVAGTVETDQGVDLGNDFALTFYTRLDDGRPMVTIASPVNGATGTDPLQPITLTFSKPVNRASFYTSLSLSPSFRAAYTWSEDGLSCVITPLEALKSPSVYTVKVGAAAADTEGNTLGTDVSVWFSVGTRGPGPVSTRVQGTPVGSDSPAVTLNPVNASGTVTFDSGFERTWGLEMDFDAPVVRSGLDSLITVEPPWSFSIPYGAATVQKVRLVPGAPLVYGTVYTLTLHKGITDAVGNPSTTERVYRFKVDGPGSAPPVLRALVFHTNLSSPDTDTILGDHSTDYQSLHMGGFTNLPSATFLDLNFTVASGANLDSASVMTHFSVSATDASTVVAITAVGLPSPLGSPTQTVRVGLLFTRGGSGLVVFRLAAGLADSLGNVTLDDQSWPVLE